MVEVNEWTGQLEKENGRKAVCTWQNLNMKNIMKIERKKIGKRFIYNNFKKKNIYIILEFNNINS